MAIERYLVQKAMEAFEDLAGDGEWSDRLSWASSRLSLVSGGRYMASASAETRKAMHEVAALTPDTDYPTKARAIREAIEAIFEEWGRRSIEPSP